ncbi:MAG: deoxyribodipyrimidine photo-lyase, partial [Candidatus Krumholzibacteria bacterium]|nr:deoxyribodipyrimidine photo-lyase [Candidatus Krumholzibacteria bacterium]
GLADAREGLRRRGAALVVRCGDPPDIALGLGAQAALIVCDRGYLRHQKRWRARVASKAPCPVFEVESDVVVPVGEVSGKAEYAARTLRPRIERRLDEFLVELRPTALEHDSNALRLEGIDLKDLDAVLSRLDIDRSVPPVPLFRGGETSARRALERFVDGPLGGYAANRNRPETDFVSYLGMHLHFGQLSPVRAAMRVAGSGRGSAEDRAVFLEEMIVRRELSCNFVEYTGDYDRFSCLPAWARATLARHASDPRSPRYTARQLEAARTHDPYWNAAMREMRCSGYMHNYMRMYWGKKILEWSSGPAHAFRTILALNNRYFIDGRDPNSFAGVAWIFGKHDRPWSERNIFGTVRYLSAGGLERKADPAAYVEKIDALEARLGAARPGERRERGAR